MEESVKFLHGFAFYKVLKKTYLFEYFVMANLV